MKVKLFVCVYTARLFRL